MLEPSEVSRLVRTSAAGNAAAWNELVRRYSPPVMAVTRSHRLSAASSASATRSPSSPSHPRPTPKPAS